MIVYIYKIGDFGSTTCVSTYNPGSHHNLVIFYLSMGFPRNPGLFFNIPAMYSINEVQYTDRHTGINTPEIIIITSPYIY